MGIGNDARYYCDMLYISTLLRFFLGGVICPTDLPVSAAYAPATDRVAIATTKHRIFQKVMVLIA